MMTTLNCRECENIVKAILQTILLTFSFYWEAILFSYTSNFIRHLIAKLQTFTA